MERIEGMAWEWPGNGFMRLATRARSGLPTAPGRKVGGHYLRQLLQHGAACSPRDENHGTNPPLFAAQRIALN